MAKIKLQDIAEICRLDISTVSRALRDDPVVKSGTRKRIQKTAASLGYRPNLLARNLAGGRTRTIWLILPSLDATIDQQLVRHASHYANQQDYTLFVALHDSDNFGDLIGRSCEHYRQILESAAQGTADGVIVVPRRGADDTNLLKDLINQEFPIVFLDNHPDGLASSAVTSENESGARELTRRCLEGGATGAILLFSEPNTAAQARLEGTRAELRQCGVPFVEQLTPEGLENLGSCIAIIASSQTHHILPFVAKNGQHFKDKTLIFGVFDDWVGEPAPAKTVYVAVQDAAAMAKFAIDRVIAQIEKRPDSVQRMVRVPILEFKESMTYRTQ